MEHALTICHVKISDDQLSSETAIEKTCKSLDKWFGNLWQHTAVNGLACIVLGGQENASNGACFINIKKNPNPLVSGDAVTQAWMKNFRIRPKYLKFSRNPLDILSQQGWIDASNTIKLCLIQVYKQSKNVLSIKILYSVYLFSMNLFLGFFYIPLILPLLFLLTLSLSLIKFPLFIQQKQVIIIIIHPFFTFPLIVSAPFFWLTAKITSCNCRSPISVFYFSVYLLLLSFLIFPFSLFLLLLPRIHWSTKVSVSSEHSTFYIRMSLFSFASNISAPEELYLS